MQNAVTNTLGIFRRETGAYKKLASLAIPILLQNLIGSSLAMFDTAMVGTLGQNELAGLSLSNTPFFVVMLFVFGIQSGSSVLMAQYWGKRDTNMINRVMGISALAAGVITCLFALAVTVFPYQIMGITSNNAALVDVAARYGRIVAFSYFFNSLTMVQVGAQRSVENPRFGMIVLSISMLLNVFFNWVLIFGKFGLPAMGVEGAALATLIARVIEFIMTVVYVLFINKRIPFEAAAFFKPGRDAVKKFIHYATPVMINETLWGLGTSTFPVIYGHMLTSSDNVAAFSVTGNLDKILTVGIFAIANSAAIIIGNQVGKGASKQEVYETGKWLHALSFIMGLIAGLTLTALALFGAEGFIFEIFELTPNAQRITVAMMYIMAVAYMFRCFNSTNIVGILRGGGDVKTAMYIDVLALYLYAVPAAAIVALVFKADMTVVYIFIVLEEIIKLVVGMKRFVSRNWIRNVTLGLDGVKT